MRYTEWHMSFGGFRGSDWTKYLPQECSFEREKEKSSNNVESFTLKRGRSVPTVALRSMPNLSRTTLLRRQMVDYEGSWRLNPLTKLWARICMHFTWAVRPLLQSWENFHRPHVPGLLCLSLNPHFSKIRLPIWWLLYTFYAEGHRTELWRSKISQRHSAKEAERRFFVAIAPRNHEWTRGRCRCAEFLLMCESWAAAEQRCGFRLNFKASWSI